MKNINELKNQKVVCTYSETKEIKPGEKFFISTSHDYMNLRGNNLFLENSQICDYLITPANNEITLILDESSKLESVNAVFHVTFKLIPEKETTKNMKQLNVTCVCGNGFFTDGKEYNIIKGDGFLTIDAFDIFDFEIDYNLGKIVIKSYSIDGEKSVDDKDIEFKINYDYGNSISKPEEKTNKLLTLVPHFSRKATKELHGLLKISFSDDEYQEYRNCYGILNDVGKNSISIDIRIIQGLENIKDLINFEALDEDIYTISAKEIYQEDIKIEKIDIKEMMNDTTIYLNKVDLDNLLDEILKYFSKGYVNFELKQELSSRNKACLINSIKQTYKICVIDGNTIIRK